MYDNHESEVHVAVKPKSANWSQASWMLKGSLLILRKNIWYLAMQKNLNFSVPKVFNPIAIKQHQYWIILQNNTFLISSGNFFRILTFYDIYAWQILLWYQVCLCVIPSIPAVFFSLPCVSCLSPVCLSLCLGVFFWMLRSVFLLLPVHLRTCYPSTPQAPAADIPQLYTPVFIRSFSLPVWY